MANEAGVVKSVTGGSVRALNNATGEVRNLSVGDIVYQNEKIITDSADSKVTITQTDGKEITLIGKDTITLDQDTNNNQTVADISALQQAILNGTDLNALEETAAGGTQAGGNAGDGVSLSSTSFAEGGHISNIYANYGNLPDNGDNYVSDYSAISGGRLDTNATPESQPQPQPTPPAIMEIPSSAYNIEMGRNNSGKLGINAETRSNYNTMRDSNMDPSLDRSNDYFKSLNEVQGKDKSSISATSDASQAQKISDSDISKAFKDAVDGLTIDKGEISAGDKLLQKHYIENYQDKFDYQDGWFISKDKSTIIGSDNAKKLAIVGKDTDTSGYDDSYTIVRVGDKAPSVFGSDKADNITVDGAKVQMISTGTGDDTINVKNGAEILTNINSGSGNDTINVDGEGTKVNGEEIVNHTTHKIRQGGIIAGDGDDIINITNKAKVKAGIYDGDGNDHINIKGGATVGTVGIEDVSARYKSIDKYKDGREITDEDRISMEAQFQQRSGVQLGHGKNEVTIEGKDTAVSRVTGYKYNHDGEFKNEDWTNTVTVKDKATVSFDIDINSINKDTVNVENNATVRGTIFTGKGSDTINVTNNSKVGGIRAESDGDTINITDSTVGGEGSFYGSSTNKDKGNFNGDDSVNKNQFEGVNGDGNDVFDTVNGKDTITIKNSTVNGTIWGGGYDDKIEISGGSVINGIIDGEGGNDKITVNNSTVNGRAAKDYKGNDIKEAIVGGKGDDKVFVQNESNVKGNVSGDQGSNIIAVEGGSKVAGWVYGANAKTADMYNETGKNTIVVTGKNTEVSRVGDVSSGDSTIMVTDKAKVKSVHGDKGVDTIMVDNATVAEKIEGGHGDDKIYVRNGARVEGYVTGDLDNDTININGNAKVQGGFIGAGAGTDDKINISGNAEVSSAFLKLGASSYNNGKTTDKTTLNVTEDAVIDGVTILSGESLGKQVMNFHQNGEAKIKQINGSNNKDVIDIKGGDFTIANTLPNGKIYGNGGDDEINIHDGATAKIKADMGEGVDTLTVSSATLKDSVVEMGLGNDEVNINAGATIDDVSIKTGADVDTVTIKNSTLNHTEILTGAGVDTVNIEGGISFADSTINTGADNDIVNINSDITGNNQSNIKTDAGSDTINIASGVTLTRTVVDMGSGEDTIELKGNNATDDRITFKGSTLYTDNVGNAVDYVDKVTISNTTFMKSDDGRLSSVRTGSGGDEITIKEGTVFQDLSYIATENGNDKITLESGTTFDQANVYAGAGDDIINVNGAEFKGDNVYNHNAGIHGGAGDDRIFVNSGKFDNARIEGDAGDDTIHIKAGARFENSSICGDNLRYETGNDTIIVEKGVTLINTTIDGGDGYDTLKIADDSLDLTKVTNIEKLDLTQGNHNVSLSAKDVLDMTDNNNRLRIDGDSGDNLGLASKGWVEDTSANIDGYTVYTSTFDGKTTTLEVQNQVHVDI